MKQLSFKAIEKKLERKNAELVEVREFRKKLDDKEKEIVAAIDALQNRKVEVIFEQVKKEIKNKNLDISSVSALAIVDALKNSQQILNTDADSEEVSKNVNSVPEKFDSEIQAEKILPEEKFETESPKEIPDEEFLNRLNAISADKVSEEK